MCLILFVTIVVSTRLRSTRYVRHERTSGWGGIWNYSGTRRLLTFKYQLVQTLKSGQALRVSRGIVLWALWVKTSVSLQFKTEEDVQGRLCSRWNCDEERCEPLQYHRNLPEQHGQFLLAKTRKCQFVRNVWDIISGKSKKEKANYFYLPKHVQHQHVRASRAEQL